MNRKNITEFLSDLLVYDKFSGSGKYYASEVVLDYGTSHPKRIDYLQYIPNGATYVGEIENGRFICYEIKSCKEDIYSGSGLNFIGDENYIVTTMDCYKSLLPDIQSGKLFEHIRKMNDGRNVCFEFLIAVPYKKDMDRFNPNKAFMDEYDNTTPLGEYSSWRLVKHSIGFNRNVSRRRSTTELLFCMLRAGR